MNILLIMAHPRKNSFSGALAESYHTGAVEANQDIKQLNLCELEFEKDVVQHSPKNQPIEACIQEAQNLIKWADHLVFIYPTWWGTFPALLKAFLDRTLTEGFAFEEVEGGIGYKKLLNNKSAEIFTTMDTPAFIYKHLYKSPGNKAIGAATLKFCGVFPVLFKSFGPVRGSSDEQRQKWLDQTKKSALLYANEREIDKFSRKRNLQAWLKAVRFQFYPMSSLGFLLGSLLATYIGNSFNYLIFFLGILWMFFLELATVLINEKVDYKSDKQNKYYSPFSGGSRVLVDEMLSFEQINKGIFACIVTAVVLTALILFYTPSSLLPTLMVIAISTFLAIGYTAPPIKLGYRGFAALDVGTTHSFGVMVTGFVFQGGSWQNPIVWLVGIPLFLSIIPSIILAGIPDMEADKSVGKKTVAVRFGKKKAAKIATAITVFSMLATVLIYFFSSTSEIFSAFIFLAFFHGVYLVHQLLGYIRNTSPPNRIDGLIITSLTFIFWFVLIPVLVLLLN